jgi:protein-disulfide isomerase
MKPNLRNLAVATILTGVLTLTPHTYSQEVSKSRKAAGQSTDEPQAGPQQEQMKTQALTINIPESISKSQADAILGELKQIRQLLEKQEAQLARVGTAATTGAPVPPQKVQMSVATGWYSIGRADAPVTLVEFSDYQCPFCKRFHTDAYAELKKNYIDTGKLRFVSRDLPLEFHPFALKAAEAVRCAGDQNKYWELRDALYTNAAPPNDDVIKEAAKSLSLDAKGFQSCLDSDKYKADVQKDASEAATLQISGTPTFVLAKSAKDKLDGVRIVGAQPFAAFQAAIDNLLKTEVALKN